MANYQELYSAHVRRRAEEFADVYQTLQHLIKSRTKAGYIDGFADLKYLYKEHFTLLDNDVMKVVITAKSRTTGKSGIWFGTKR